MPEPRFYWQDLDECNVETVVHEANHGRMVGIMDVKEGGIIVYAMSTATAQLIVQLLQEYVS